MTKDKKDALVLLTIAGLVLTIFVLLLTSHVNKPVIYPLTGDKTPVSQYEPMPTGADPSKWEAEYSYKVVGELVNFNQKKYQQQYPNDIVIAHKEGAFTLYLKNLPDPNFFHDGFIVVKE